MTADDVLLIWERGRDGDVLTRAIVMWQVLSQRDVSDLELETIGARDAALIANRIASRGSSAECYVECPECSEALEFNLDLSQMLFDDVPTPDLTGHTTVEQTDVTFRLPTTADLRVAHANPQDAVSTLIERCVLAVTVDGEPVEWTAIDPLLQRSVDQAMHALDPQSDLQIKLDCAACSHQWVTKFDIAVFFWRELEIEARRVLRQVHRLAAAYGWTEAEVLSLSDARRTMYLDLVSG